MNEKQTEPLIAHPPRRDWTKNTSIQQLIVRYDTSLAWLTEFLEINSRSRLKRYQDILSRLGHLTKSQDIVRSLESEDCKSAFYEAHEIVEVCETLKNVSESVEIPIATLRNLKSNNFLNYREARESGLQDDSRPTFFELYVASRLIKAGLDVGFTVNDEDLFTTFEDHKVFIECKRIVSPRKFYSRINEGNVQLVKRYTAGRTREFGIVFASISNLVNPDFDTFTARTISDAMDESHQMVDAYTNRIFELVNRHGWPDKKTVAYYVHAAIPYVVAEGPAALHRTVTSFSSYFHHSGQFPQREHAPKRRMKYYDEFERFRKLVSG